MMTEEVSMGTSDDIDDDIEEDSDEFASSTAEDDDEKQAFLNKLTKFMRDRGTPIGKLPQLGGRALDLYKLYKEVIARGGTELVRIFLLNFFTIIIGNGT